MEKIVGKNKRKYLRFEPEDLGFAVLDFSEGEKFTAELGGLVYEEGYGGCGLVLLAGEREFALGQTFKIKVGTMPVIDAEVRWVNQIDDMTIRLGVGYHLV